MSNTLVFGPHEWQVAYRAALRVLRVPDQAEDAAQDALLNAYRARADYDGRSRPTTWLYQIARRAALSYLRKPFVQRYAAANVDQVLEQQRSDDQTDSPEAAASYGRLASALQSCLQSMRDEDRLAFTERFLLGTSERELGRMLGVSTNAAKQRAFRARRTVRARMAEAKTG